MRSLITKLKQFSTARWLFVLFIAIIVGSLVAFLWCELDHLSWHKKIDDDKVASFFTVIGASATAISIYLLYRQLDVSAKQQRPSLFLEQKVFKYFYAIRKNVKLRDNQTDAEELRPFVDFVNYGNVIATEIAFKWKLEKLKKRKPVSVEFESIEHNVAHISANAKAKMHIPYEIVSLILNEIGISLEESEKFPEQKFDTLDSKYLITCHILYHDIDDNEFSKQYNCTVLFRVNTFDIDSWQLWLLFKNAEGYEAKKQQRLNRLYRKIMGLDNEH